VTLISCPDCGNQVDDRAPACPKCGDRQRSEERGFVFLQRTVPVVVLLLSLTLGVAQLYSSHPAEDAYIVFRYVENFAAGHGIVFYPGGPRTEGVTDCLWFLMLSVLVSLGFNVAVAAVVLNALGGALAAGLFERELARMGIRGAPALALAAFPLVLPCVGGALAAYLGFSSMLYSALGLALLVLALDGRARAIGWLPWFSLLMALFRPDGVAIGVGFTLLGFARAVRAGSLRFYLAHAVSVTLVGVVYLAGRYAYFGLPLPLPLYVKAQGTMSGPLADRILQYLPWFHGLAGNLSWLKSPEGPAPFLAFGTLLALTVPKTERDEVRRLLAAFLPFVAFFLLLALAFQSQNVHFRFQAPLSLAILFATFRLTARNLRSRESALSRLAIVALLWLAAFRPLAAGGHAIVADLQNRSYIDVFPARLAAVLGAGRSLALTEAGRLPYGVQARVFDVVGLNNADTALRPPSLAYLNEIDPDLVFFHSAYVFDVESELGPPTRGLERIPATLLCRCLNPRYREVFERGFAAPGDNLSTIDMAPLVLGRYLVEHRGDYETLVVRYRGRWVHVYGVRNSLPEAGRIVAELGASTSGVGYASYAAIKGFSLARRFDAVIDGRRKPRPVSQEKLAASPWTCPD
jgi:hypothetical protein